MRTIIAFAAALFAVPNPTWSDLGEVLDGGTRLGEAKVARLSETR